MTNCARARDRAVERRLQVGVGLGDDREHDARASAPGAARAGPRSSRATPGPRSAVGQPAGDLDHAVDQRRHDGERRPRPRIATRDQLGEERREDARHEPVEPVGDRQDRVGDDGADDERRERRPRGDGERQRERDDREREQAAAERLGRDASRAGRGGLPSGRGRARVPRDVRRGSWLARLPGIVMWTSQVAIRLAERHDRVPSIGRGSWPHHRSRDDVAGRRRDAARACSATPGDRWRRQGVPAIIRHRPRTRGVAAQHASLSRWRSPVRIRSGPPSFPRFLSRPVRPPGRGAAFSTRLVRCRP